MDKAYFYDHPAPGTFKEIKELCREFLHIMNKVEETDEGREFRPNNISSCRCMDLDKIGKILKRIGDICDES